MEQAPHKQLRKGRNFKFNLTIHSRQKYKLMNHMYLPFSGWVNFELSFEYFAAFANIDSANSTIIINIDCCQCGSLSPKIFDAMGTEEDRVGQY